MPATIVKKPVLQVCTVHYVEIEWFWKESHLHKSDYTFEVLDKVSAEIKRVCKLYEDVSNDESYCCQWEGFRLAGSNLEDVVAAGNQIAAYLTRFKHINFVEWQ